MTETKKGIAKAKANFGEQWKYKRRKGTIVDLTLLKPKTQQVCYGGKTWHILMTLKPEYNYLLKTNIQINPVIY